MQLLRNAALYDMLIIELRTYNCVIHDRQLALPTTENPTTPMVTCSLQLLTWRLEQ
jgi:hypothetical protein